MIKLTLLGRAPRYSWPVCHRGGSKDHSSAPQLSLRSSLHSAQFDAGHLECQGRVEQLFEMLHTDYTHTHTHSIAIQILCLHTFLHKHTHTIHRLSKTIEESC